MALLKLLFIRPDFVRALLKVSLIFILLFMQACFTTESSHEIKPDFSIQLPADDNRLIQQLAVLLFNNQPFTGKLFTLNEERDTLSVSYFSNGMEHGMSIKWYANKQKQEERNYKNGKRVGLHQCWYENGRLKFRYQYENDAMNGMAEEWYASGKKCKEMNYKEGYESGLQRMWGPDGSIKANYVARNGRNYGLTGTKNCKNVWEEIKH